MASSLASIADLMNVDVNYIWSEIMSDVEKIIVGEQYNLWKVLEFVGKKEDDIWLCECRCGRKRRMSTSKLLMYKNHAWHHNGCGYCESDRYKDHPRIIVDGARIPVYGAWCNMRKRCFDPSHKLYKHYGGRGITVCDEWMNSFLDFYNYVSKLDHYGEPGRSLDRIDNEKGYFPGNVRWATSKEQANNTRRSKKDGNGSDTQSCTKV